MLRYENSKTKSLLIVPENITIKEVDDWAYIIKMMIYNDNRIIKDEMQKLIACLNQIKNKKVSR